MYLIVSLMFLLGVEHDETPNGILLEVSFMPKAVFVSELSDEDFTEVNVFQQTYYSLFHS